MTRPVTFWWVRHGPTHQRTFTGWRDVPADLSDTAALARLEACLPSEALVVSSDLCRAADTAAALTRQRERLPPMRDLREFDFGAWDGMGFQEVAERDPDLSRLYWENPGAACPPGGESWNTASARVDRAVSSLAAAHPGRHVVAVAHLGVILTRLQAARGISPAEAIGQHIAPLSLTRIEMGVPPCVHEVNHCP